MFADETDRIEAEPLLAADDDADARTLPDPGLAQARPKRRLARRLQSLQARKPSAIVLLLAVLMFAIAVSAMLIMVPMFRLMEDAICHVHYDMDRAESIEERLCKVDPVQKQLAYLGGWAAMINSLVGLVAALPYGVLADRIGRKPAFILSYVGIVLAFSWGPLVLALAKTPNFYLLIMGSVFFLVGGGVPVAMNSLNAMASDISGENEKAAAFLYLSFGGGLGGLAGPITAGLLMETLGPWCPIILVFAITPFVFGLVLFVPETLPKKMRQATEQEEQPLAERMREATRELAVSLSLLKNPNVALSLVPFFMQPALFAAYSSTLAQHISNYFGWTLARTNYLLSPLGVLQLTVILVLPRATSFLTNPSGRFRLSAFSKDLLLAKFSLSCLILGALIEGFSRDIVLFLVGLTVGSFGSSSGPLCRAVATAYVAPQQTSRLYALVSMLETGGAVAGGPVLAWCFNMGLSRRGVWTGLPWFYVAGLMSVALFSLMPLRQPKQKAPLLDPEDEANADLGYQS